MKRIILAHRKEYHGVLLEQTLEEHLKSTAEKAFEIGVDSGIGGSAKVIEDKAGFYIFILSNYSRPAEPGSEYYEIYLAVRHIQAILAERNPTMSTAKPIPASEFFSAQQYKKYYDKIEKGLSIHRGYMNYIYNKVKKALFKKFQPYGYDVFGFSEDFDLTEEEGFKKAKNLAVMPKTGELLFYKPNRF